MSYDDTDLCLSVDVLAKKVGHVASAIKSGDGVGHDAAGGGVASLTEAVMGTTAGLMEIAGAIRELAEAVRGANED